METISFEALAAMAALDQRANLARGRRQPLRMHGLVAETCGPS
jgi:hypothetical protein